MKTLICFLTFFGLNYHLQADIFSVDLLKQYVSKQTKGVILENNEPCSMTVMHSVNTIYAKFWGFVDDPDQNDSPYRGLVIEAGFYPLDTYSGFRRPKQNVFLYHNYIWGYDYSFYSEETRVITVHFDSKHNINRIQFNLSDDNNYELNCIIEESR